MSIVNTQIINTSNITPNTSNITPNTSNITPNTSNITPNTTNYTPNTTNYTPNTTNYTPNTSNITPDSLTQQNKNKYILIITIVAVIILMVGLIIYFVYFSDDTYDYISNDVVANNSINTHTQTNTNTNRKTNTPTNTRTNTQTNTSTNTSTNTQTNTNTQPFTFIPSEEFIVSNPISKSESTNNTLLIGLQNTDITQIEPFVNIKSYSNNYEYFGNVGQFQPSEETQIIVFDSISTIINHYDIFIKTYFPLLNYDRMDTKVKEITRKTIIQLLQEKSRRYRNLNPIRLLRESRKGYREYMGLVFGMDDQTYFKLLCMSILLFKKINNPRIKLCTYYPLEDPKNQSDFITYIGSCKKKEEVKEIHKNNKNDSPRSSLNSIIDSNSLKKITWKDEFLRDLILYSGLSEEKNNRKIEINIINFVKSLQTQKELVLKNYEDEIINLMIKL